MPAKTKLLSFCLVAALFFSLAPAQPVSASEFNPSFIIGDFDMVNYQSMTLSEIQQFLEQQGGALATYMTEDLDGVRKRASEIIYRVANEFLISPKFILVMLQKEQSLVTHTNPSQGRLDWATGYAVCDSCNVNEDGVSRFRGFAKQIDSMARQFRFGYLEDLTNGGTTVVGLSAGQPYTIDGQRINPENNATAAMYTYTPHFEGNQNFWSIFGRWFGHGGNIANIIAENVEPTREEFFPSGTLVRNMGTGELWRIWRGHKQRIPSMAVLLSYFREELIVDATADQLAAYPEEGQLSYPNYSLVRKEDGDVFLIVGNQRRRFQNLADIARFGYAPDEIIDGTDAELATYEQGSVITYETAFPQGAVFRDDRTGNMYYIDGNRRHFIASDSIRRARFDGWRIRSITTDELSRRHEGTPVMFPEGTLVMHDADPTVYMISEGKRRPITDEYTFLTLGFDWSDIIVTSIDAINVHQPGDLIHVDEEHALASK